ncbi:MAG: c-type cytochrome [Gemmatimonadota bacterium]
MRRLSSVITGGALFALFALVGCGGGDGDGQKEAAADAAQMAEADAMSGEAMADQQQAGQQKEEQGDAAPLIEQGREIFVGAGLCYACHGNNGEGIPTLGANLTDNEWLHNDGSMEGIVETILSGVPAEKSSTGTPMPPKGGSSITDDQVKAVAAFVLSLSGGGK